MILRYKDSKVEFESSSFNVHALCEVLTGDDSVYCRDLDAFINGVWKDFLVAMKDKDIIPDNYNRYFYEPRTQEDRDRGYIL
jgi:hypothetical protein